MEPDRQRVGPDRRLYSSPKRVKHYPHRIKKWYTFSIELEICSASSLLKRIILQKNGLIIEKIRQRRPNWHFDTLFLNGRELTIREIGDVPPIPEIPEIKHLFLESGEKFFQKSSFVKTQNSSAAGVEKMFSMQNHGLIFPIELQFCSEV